MLGTPSQPSGHPITTASRPSPASHLASFPLRCPSAGLARSSIDPHAVSDVCSPSVKDPYCQYIDIGRFNALRSIVTIDFWTPKIPK